MRKSEIYRAAAVMWVLEAGKSGEVGDGDLDAIYFLLDQMDMAQRMEAKNNDNTVRAD